MPCFSQNMDLEQGTMLVTSLYKMRITLCISVALNPDFSFVNSSCSFGTNFEVKSPRMKLLQVLTIASYLLTNMTQAESKHRHKSLMVG